MNWLTSCRRRGRGLLGTERAYDASGPGTELSFCISSPRYVRNDYVIRVHAVVWLVLTPALTDNLFLGPNFASRWLYMESPMTPLCDYPTLRLPCCAIIPLRVIEAPLKFVYSYWYFVYLSLPFFHSKFKNPSPHAHHSNVVQSAGHMYMCLYEVK